MKKVSLYTWQKKDAVHDGKLDDDDDDDDELYVQGGHDRKKGRYGRAAVISESANLIFSKFGKFVD